MTTTPAEFGFSAWGAEIVRLAEPLSTRTPNPLAPRARSIARNGGVTLTVDGRHVEGLVQRGGEASVAHLEFSAMTSTTAVVLRDLLGSSAEPSDEVHRRLKESGAWSPAVLDVTDCSCRARGDRCLHILAGLYAVAAAVDRQPSLALELRDFRAATDDSPTDSGTCSPGSRWVSLTAFDVADYYEITTASEHDD